MITLDWLSPPTDFRQSLRAALAAQGAAEQLERLAELAQLRLGFVETIQVDNALKTVTRALGSEPASAFAQLRIALLSSSTIDHLVPALRVACLRRRLLVDIYTGSFGQHRQDLMDASSSLHAFAPQVVLLSLSARESLAGVPLTSTAAQVQRSVETAVGDLRELWQRARGANGATVIQQTFLDVTEPLFGSYDRQVPASPSRVVARLNDQVAEAALQDGVLLLDIAAAAARDGLERWFDVGRWLQGKIEIAPQAAPLYGELAARLLAAQRGGSRKCLVLDLDNTLWGGVVGDVGVEGIVLGEGSAAGEAHLALQRYALALKERGIILAVCSKNEAATAEAAFRDHPEMALKRTDITAFVANWTDKAANLRSIAAQLNIGLDSLVFVDDNPAERERVRADLPMVAVPEMPGDPALYVQCLAAAGYFEAVEFTDEDRQRVGQYAANIERENLRSSFQSMDDYLRGLDMTVTYGPVTHVELARAAQLVNKTNQFNTTTRRLAAEELATLLAQAGNFALQFRLTDRFGDNGLVSVMILCRHPQDSGIVDLHCWVMSCRVFGRQLEDEAMNIAAGAARERGFRELRADLIATKKNTVIAKLFDSLGFMPLGGDAPEGTSRWTIDLASYSERPTFINRRAQA
jgi:FkbH-like protein